MCHTWFHLYAISTICLRFFTVYGPRQRPDLAIHHFAKSILERKPIQIYGDGSSLRDYTYITDIIHGIIGALQLLFKQNMPLYRIYNLGSSMPISLYNLLYVLEKTMKIKPQIQFVSNQLGDVGKTWADITQANDDINYSPQVDINSGILKFVEWLLSSTLG